MAPKSSLSRSQRRDKQKLEIIPYSQTYLQGSSLGVVAKAAYLEGLRAIGIFIGPA